MQHISKIMHKNTDSPIEELIYEELLKYGLKPETQYRVGYFFIDLAFPEIKLAIEADGRDFHSTEEQKKRDWYRQSKLEEQGWKFERFSGSFVNKYKDFIAAKIAMKYYGDSLSEELRQKAIGRISNYFMVNQKHRDMDFGIKLAEAYLRENNGVNTSGLADKMRLR